MNQNKLLYVDDEFINLQLFKFNFQKEYELFLASSGPEALSILEKEDIKVIISDLKMPGMNGIELIKSIKHKSPNKICLMLSAYYISEAKEMGLDESLIHKYIVKPWNKTEIIASLSNLFPDI
ncbi:MAG: response regulator [Salinivirgaceae bacterium]|jgi:response regulator RpfG family c-di-GMP phosphodiesterase